MNHIVFCPLPLTLTTPPWNETTINQWLLMWNYRCCARDKVTAIDKATQYHHDLRGRYGRPYIIYTGTASEFIIKRVS